MATVENIQTVNLVAGQDLSAKQFHFVSVAADGEIDPTGDGLRAQGVLLNDPAKQGQAACVAIGGITKVICGGVVTRGGPVASDSAGKAVNAGTGDVVMGTALDTGSTGAIIRLLFQPR